MTRPMTLLLPKEYIKDATKLIKKATTRVAFICMILTDDESTDDLIDALAAAARRGVAVHVAGDMFTYTEMSGQFIPSHYYSKRVRSTTRMAKELHAAGVDFHWLGRLNISTVSGRTHSKWCVVDDTVFSFGGVNLYEEALGNIDYMFKVEDKSLADKIIREHEHIIKADRGRFDYRSHSYALSSQSTVLFDAGFFGDSIIYERACALAADSTRIQLISQYCPTGKLNQLLKQTHSTLYFNPWQQASGLNRFIIRVGSWLSRQTSSYTKAQYLHAKFIIFTLISGEKVAITGSHNFVHGGVLLGTREIALETRDPAIIAQLESFLETYIA